MHHRMLCRTAAFLVGLLVTIFASPLWSVIAVLLGLAAMYVSLTVFTHRFSPPQRLHQLIRWRASLSPNVAQDTVKAHKLSLAFMACVALASNNMGYELLFSYGIAVYSYFQILDMIQKNYEIPA